MTESIPSLGEARRPALSLVRRPFLPRYHGVVEPIVGQTVVALDTRVAKRGVFVPAEGENGLVHLLGVEHLEADKQVKVLDRQTGNDQKQIRFQLRNYILQLVLAEV